MGFLSFYTAFPRHGSYVLSTAKSEAHVTPHPFSSDPGHCTQHMPPGAISCPKNPPRPTPGLFPVALKHQMQFQLDPVLRTYLTQTANFGPVGVVFGSKCMPMSLGGSV